MKSAFKLFLSCAFSAALLCGCTTTDEEQADKKAIQEELERLNTQSATIIKDIKKEVRSLEVIMPTDQVTVEVWLKDKKTQFKGFPLVSEVPNSGKLFIPNVGKTVISGMTDKKLEDLLSENFKKILVDPTIVVSHKQKERPGNQMSVQEGRFVTVMGWIKKPGIYPIGQHFTVRDAIATAGDTKQFAKRTRVFLVRGPVKDPKVFKINMEEIARGENMLQNMPLYHNDALYIAPKAFWTVYDNIRTALLPITAVRDALLTGTAAEALAAP